MWLRAWCHPVGRLPTSAAKAHRLPAAFSSRRLMCANVQTVVRVTSFDDKVQDGWANIEVTTAPKPTANAGEALVRITTRPLNPSDLIRAAGRYGPWADTFVNGGEGAHRHTAACCKLANPVFPGKGFRYTSAVSTAA